jgi:hypothetical protein
MELVQQIQTPPYGLTIWRQHFEAVELLSKDPIADGQCQTMD